MLAEQGPAAVTLREIARRAGVSHGAPLRHFPSLANLLAHVSADGSAVQANMMASPEVWPAMADAYVSATGRLPRRLLAALNAAQAAGGDARGVMSAAMVVVGGTPEAGRLLDLRVDRSRDPLGELARLLDAADAYQRFNRATYELFGGDANAALTGVEEGLAILPGEPNLRFPRAAALLARGDLDPAASSCGRCWPATQPGRPSSEASPPRACSPCQRRPRSTN